MDDNVKVLTLDSIPTLKELIGGGGGSSVTLLDTYTATPTDSEAYNASYINSKISGVSLVLGAQAGSAYTFSVDTPVLLGNSAKATRTSSVTTANRGVAIGYNSSVNATTTNNTILDVSIGANSSSSSTSVAVGSSARAQGNGVAVGADAAATYNYSVAVGYYSTATRASEVSFGRGTGSTAYTTRYLANVKAGELDTDAVNLKQMQDYVAAQIGDVATALETLTTGAGV